MGLARREPHLSKHTVKCAVVVVIIFTFYRTFNVQRQRNKPPVNEQDGRCLQTFIAGDHLELDARAVLVRPASLNEARFLSVIHSW